MKFRPITDPVANSVTVIFHADCPDGFGAALAAWKHFGNAARYIPMHHGESWERLELTGHSVYILDFSFARAILEDIASLAHTVIQIDHHASARAPWLAQLKSSFGGCESFQHPTLPLTVTFNLEKSGARLAWEHFFPASPMPLPLRHIEDMDMWRFALPGTRAFSRALRLLPLDFATWEQLISEAASLDSPRYQTMLTEGGAIEHFFRCEVDRLANSHLVMPAVLRGEVIDPLQAIRHDQPFVTAANQTWHAVSGLAANADSLFASELGNKLAERSGTFGLVWQLADNGEVKASLRASGKIDVATIATRYGGGGHPNAAGFRMPAKKFCEEILDMARLG